MQQEVILAVCVVVMAAGVLGLVVLLQYAKRNGRLGTARGRVAPGRHPASAPQAAAPSRQPAPAAQPAPSAHAPRPEARLPMKLGNLVLDRHLGGGGKAEVFRARNGSQQVVAVKILDPNLRRSPEDVERFLHEAPVLEMIQRVAPQAPVIRCYAAHQDPYPYLVMQHLDGVALDQLLLPAWRKNLKCPRRLSQAEAEIILRDIGRALLATHRAGYCHQDMSPSNIMVWQKMGRVQRAVLLDFGEAVEQNSALARLNGFVNGKVPYLSPEQCAGLMVTPESDLWALGVVLYCVLTGRRPFTHKDPQRLMQLIQKNPVPALPRSVREPLRGIVHSWLQKDPTQRLSLDQALELIQAGSPT